MSQSSSMILQHYREIATATEGMLSAARSSDWATVLQLGQQYCELVERLRDLGPEVPLNQTERIAKHDLLVRILENDAITRDLAVPQLARLGDLLGRMKQQQSLLRVYGLHKPFVPSSPPAAPFSS